MARPKQQYYTEELLDNPPIYLFPSLALRFHRYRRNLSLPLPHVRACLFSALPDRPFHTSAGAASVPVDEKGREESDHAARDGGRVDF